LRLRRENSFLAGAAERKWKAGSGFRRAFAEVFDRRRRVELKSPANLKRDGAGIINMFGFYPSTKLLLTVPLGDRA
jgi:hypothetical protein